MDAVAFVCDRVVRLNMFINSKSSHSIRQNTLEIAAVCKFAYLGQLICISSER